MSEVDVRRAPPVLAEDWDAFEAPEGYRIEIIQGELVVSPGVALRHGRAHTALVRLLSDVAPEGFGPVFGVEWRFDEYGFVAMAPQPDIMVIPRDLEGLRLTQPPLLAVEILSPSDFQRLASGMTRREGKLRDYGAYGLRDYLEVDVTEKITVAVRYELEGSRLVEVDRAVDEEVLRAARPFPYSFAPRDLV